MAFNQLRTLVKNLEAVNAVKVANEVLQQRPAKKSIIELNTVDQLFNKGVNNQGVKLFSVTRPYAPAYARLKARRGLPSKRGTLFLTGRYHASFKAVNIQGGVQIKSEPIRNGKDIRDRFGGNIEGLTPLSIRKLQRAIIKDFRQTVKRRIFKGVK